MVDTVEAWGAFVIEMQSTNKRTKKLATVVKHIGKVREILRVMLDTRISTNVTPASINGWFTKKKRPKIDAIELFGNNLYAILAKLVDREITGHLALETCREFIRRQDPMYRDILVNTLGGKPKIGVDLKQVNQALKNAGQMELCYLYEVTLAHPYDKKYHKPIGPYYISRKYDGVRCQFHISSMFPSYAKSRYGNDLDSLKEFCQELEEGVDFVLDGEICCIDEEGNDDWNAVVGRVTKKKEQFKDFRFYIFDILTPTEFDTHTSKDRWSERIKRFNKLNLPPNMTVAPYELYTRDNLAKWQQQVNEHGWEGLMIREDCVYQSGRVHSLMKMKKFKTAEYVVKDITVGKKDMLWKGVMRPRDIMAAATIMHKGNYVNVGSGWSDEQRLEYLEHPERIIGKTIEVQYFQETKPDKNGKVSLQFPTFKYMWGKKRTV